MSGDLGDNLIALYQQITQMWLPEILANVVRAKTNDEFDQAIENLFELAVDNLERNANFFANASEEAITCNLVSFLTTPGVLYVTQETYSNGHVDITIERLYNTPFFRRLGEAKIYDGAVYHVKGLDQLVRRYSTGREGSGFVIEYVKIPKISDVVVSIRKHMDSNKPCLQQGDSQDHKIRWAFVTNHQHSSGENFRVLHLSCNLHRPPTK